MRYRWIWMALYPATFGAAVAADFDTDTDTAAAPTVSVVTVQGSAAAYDARRDDTAARIVVGRDELARFGDATVGEVLKRQSGITVDANGAIAMRGLAKGYTQILLNGERAPGGFAIDSIAPDLIERIEISRTSTADQRAEAIAGTINIILRKAGRRSARSARLGVNRSRGKDGVQGSVEFAEPGARLSRQVAAAVGDNHHLITWRNRNVGVDQAGQEDLLRDGGFDLRLRIRSVSVAPSATVKFDNGDTLALQTHVERTLVDKNARGFSDTLLGASEQVVRDTQLTHERNTQARAGLEWVHKLDPDSSLSIKLNASQHRRAADFYQQGWGVDGAVNLRDHTASGIDERSVKNSGRYARRLNQHHALVLGWEGERTTRWEDRRQSVDRDGMAPAFLHFDFDATIDRLALYLQDEWNPSERVALYLGLRGERIDLDTTGRAFMPVRRRDAMLSPSVQLLWKLPGTAGDQVRLGLARTFKAPAPVALIPRPYTSTNNAPLSPDERGNPALRPELAWGLDGAFEHHWAKGALVSLGGYVRSIDGVTRDALVVEQGRWVTFPVNGGRARLHGLEFDTRMKLADLLADVMTSTPKIDLRFNLTRNWSRVDDLPGPHNRVSEQLRLSSTVGLDYQASERMQGGVSYSYKRGGLVRTGLNRYTISASRGELDAYALLGIAPGLKLRATVSNALADDGVSGVRHVDASGQRQVLDTRTMPVVLRVALEWAR